MLYRMDKITSGMNYPSINSVEGSAARNRDAILDALAPYIEHDIGNPDSRGRVLEISSGSGEHVAAMARRWPGIEFWPSERNEEQLRFLSDGIARLQLDCKGNLKMPVQLDVTLDSDWDALSQQLDKGAKGLFSGVVICNLLHCSPSRTQNAIFSYLGRPQASDSAVENGSPGLLRAGAWVAVYGAFMKDDGGFASEGDEKFHQRFTGLHPEFGLRRIPDVESVAERYGFKLEKRLPMPAGNWMIFFRLKEA
ncbi:hypothetical protein NCC49_001191 [Naganishia albida]|nr:hypothetical protein NCC49_001191 [Naganishia albida]